MSEINMYIRRALWMLCGIPMVSYSLLIDFLCGPYLFPLDLLCCPYLFPLGFIDLMDFLGIPLVASVGTWSLLGVTGGI